MLIRAQLLCVSFLLILLGSACSSSQYKNQSALKPILFIANGPSIVQYNQQSKELLINKYALNNQAAAENVSPEQWLFKRLGNNTNDELSIDKKFISLTTIVSDNKQALEYIFYDALSRYLSQAKSACQQPLYHQYFQERYHLYKHSINCKTSIPFNVLSRYSANNITYINPKLLREVHIIFASKDDNFMSKFGHISLRLIICPTVNSSKEECDANLHQHIILGYMAHIDDIKINQLKGLLGDYRAYLYANSFMDIYQKYTISEFRHLYSLPLNLNQQEREIMLRALAEIHWGFAGDYKFINRNCSSLMQLALAAMWPNFAKSPELSTLYWRPDTFFKQLQASKLSDAKPLQTLQLAEEKGYYFPSTEPTYQRAFTVINKAMKNNPYSSLDEYIMANPIKRLETTKNNHNYLQQLLNNDYLLEAQLLLEELSLVQFELLMNAEIAYFFEEYGIKKIERYMLENLDTEAYTTFSDCMLKPMQEVLAPTKRNNGIPSTIDLVTMSTVKLCQQEDKTRLLKQVDLQLNRLAPKKWATVKSSVYYWLAIIHNIDSYKSLRS